MGASHRSLLVRSKPKNLSMEIHRVITPLALIVLMSGQLAAGAIVLDEGLGKLVTDGARPTPQGPTKKSTLPVHGITTLSHYLHLFEGRRTLKLLHVFPGHNEEGRATDVNEDKGFVPPRGYVHAPTLPPCRRKAC